MTSNFTGNDLIKIGERVQTLAIKDRLSQKQTVNVYLSLMFRERKIDITRFLSSILRRQFDLDNTDDEDIGFTNRVLPYFYDFVEEFSENDEFRSEFIQKYNIKIDRNGYEALICNYIYVEHAYLLDCERYLHDNKETLRELIETVKIFIMFFSSYVKY